MTTIAEVLQPEYMKGPRGNLIRIQPKKFRRGRATVANGRKPRFKYHVKSHGKG